MKSKERKGWGSAERAELNVRTGPDVDTSASSSVDAEALWDLYVMMMTEALTLHRCSKRREDSNCLNDVALPPHPPSAPEGREKDIPMWARHLDPTSRCPPKFPSLTAGTHRTLIFKYG